MCKRASEREKQSEDRDEERETRIYLSVTLFYDFSSHVQYQRPIVINVELLDQCVLQHCLFVHITAFQRKQK